MRPPALWGTEARLRELFDGAIAEIRVERRNYVFRATSAEDSIDYWRRFYGPILKAFEAVGAAGHEALEADLLALMAAHNLAADGTLVVPSEYLEAVIVTR